MSVGIVFIISAIIAESIGTFTGFGATTILLPIATFLMPLKTAIVLVSLFHFFGTTFRTIFFARKINLKIALLFGIPSLIFSIIGASLLSSIDPIILTRLVGILLIIYAIYSLFKEKIVLPKSPALLVGGGSFVGFIAGLIGTAGAVRGAFLTSWNLSPEVYLGTGALMGLGADTARVGVYLKDGLLQFNARLFLILALAALTGTLIGRFLVKRTKANAFTKIVFLALVLAGARLLFS